MITFQLKESKDGSEPFIELNKLLKVTQVSNSGAMSNQMIMDGIVFLNGEKENRKRAKIHRGDKIQMEEITIEVV